MATKKTGHIGFKALKKQLSTKKGIYNPGGLAYRIGVKKYGKAAMTRKAAAGRKAAKKR
jgi:hypothetical protein